MELDLPPVAVLAASEKLWVAESVADLKSHLERSGLKKELLRQAGWTLDSYNYVSPAASGFVTSPAGSLNPFSPAFKCSNLECRLRSADDFVKTVALYVDHLVVPDPLTGAFAQDEVDYDNLFSLLAVYQYVLPLIREGLLSFARPVRHYCKECAERVDGKAGVAAERILAETTADLRIEFWTPEILAVRCPALFADPQHPLTWAFPLSKEDAARFAAQSGGLSRQRLLEFVMPLLARRLKSVALTALLEMSTAQDVHATVLASARAELLCFAETDGVRPSMVGLEQWEDLRSIDLPWIHELTPAECLVLRREAKTALPRLRALLAAAFDKDNGAPRNIETVLTDLRAQVAEVEAEIRTVEKLGEGRYKVAVEGLGLAFVLYGLSTGIPAIAGAGLAGLMAALAHTQKGERETVSKKLKIESAPAFALVTAKQILGRRLAGEAPNQRLKPTPTKSRRTQPRIRRGR